MRKYKIVNKRKFVSFLIITLIITAAIIIILSKNHKVYSTTYRIPYKEVIVREGDTLWNIAINHMPANRCEKMVLK